MKCRVFGLSLLVVLSAVSALADVTWWSVPAMSGVQRLPDVIPADGERPVVECFGLRIRAEEITDRRVEWATVTVLPSAGEKPEEKEEKAEE